MHPPVPFLGSSSNRSSSKPNAAAGHNTITQVAWHQAPSPATTVPGAAPLAAERLARAATTEHQQPLLTCVVHRLLDKVQRSNFVKGVVKGRDVRRQGVREVSRYTQRLHTHAQGETQITCRGRRRLREIRADSGTVGVSYKSKRCKPRGRHMHREKQTPKGKGSHRHMHK